MTSEQSYQCTGFTIDDSSIIVQLMINKAGLHNVGLFDENGSDQILTLKTMQKRSLFYLDQGIGWLYFVLWSVSFYPQVIFKVS